MNRFIISILLMSVAMANYAQEKKGDRMPAAAGTFYTANPDLLKKNVLNFLAASGKPDETMITRAIIVPHAGYIFSGKTAAEGFASVSPDAAYERIFLIGTSHHFAFDGAAVYTSGDFITPLGKATVDSETGRKLIASCPYFISRDDVHKPEHCLEVQIPFIQCHFKNQMPLVPILIGTGNPFALKSLAKALQPYFNDHNLFVISSDFSHYPSYEDACRVDKQTSDAICKGDPDNFLMTIKELQSEGIKGLATAMCGWSSGLVLLYLAEKEKGLMFKNLSYSNSGDSGVGEKDRVVGYNAIALQEKKAAKKSSSVDSEPGFTLTDEEKKTLLSIARESIKAHLFSTKMPQIDPKKLTPVLKKPLGAFVTLTIDGQLRGCIGRFMPSDPLYEVVESMAVSAAFSDSRFTKLTADEYPDIKIEISVLGPLRKIDNINEIVIGKHGVYIKKGIYSGTLLPQVPGERGWTVEEFLGYTARDKAGIGWNGWKDADIYIYEALVFHE